MNVLEQLLALFKEETVNQDEILQNAQAEARAQVEDQVAEVTKGILRKKVASLEAELEATRNVLNQLDQPTEHHVQVEGEDSQS